VTHPHQSEADFQKAITDLATATGWDWWHIPDSRRVAAGWPDLVLARGDRCMFRELKTGTGRLRPEQVRTLDTLRRCGLDADIWRPGMWDQIEAALTAPRAVAA
jgi:hypothetical protein